MDTVASNWQHAIIETAQKKLDRVLTEPERAFIASRGGYMALEMIDETVNALDGDSLVQYLNSESSRIAGA